MVNKAKKTRGKRFKKANKTVLKKSSTNGHIKNPTSMPNLYREK